ncbi:MAG: TatD family hydrolase [Acidimicrobiales bacterium]|nr:TatD family hydrolase [Acidimicrobiales bacterium]
MRWTDDHCHLPDEGWEDVVAEARSVGVERLIDVGTDVASSRAALARAGASDAVFATAGVHPHEARYGIEGLVDLLDDPHCVAVGECGFDFHYDHSPRDIQRDVFAAQVALANERGLPLVIHAREAWAETFDVLLAEGTPDRTVFHCFTGGPDEGAACLEKGAYLSFSGIVSFPSADDVRAAAAGCPVDRMLVETDSPYLAPVPHRGKRNQPSWVVDVASALAAATDRSLDQIAEATWANADAAYGLRS